MLGAVPGVLKVQVLPSIGVLGVSEVLGVEKVLGMLGGSQEFKGTGSPGH